MSNKLAIFTNDDNLEVDDFGGTSTFQFSGVSVDVLEANSYTLATLVLDMSGSVSSYYAQLKTMIKSVIETLRDPRAPFADNILLRLVTFNGRVYEEHGFLPLTSINVDGYDSINAPSGLTSLYAACVNAAEAVQTYGMNLMQQDYEVNAINFIVTDGGDNDRSGQFTSQSVLQLTKQLETAEAVESCRSILIGMNTKYGSVKQELTQFHKEGGFDQYLDIEDATPENMGQFGSFVSKSISMQAQANGSGAASTPVDLTF